MDVTLYAADNQQIVLDTIKDTENAKPLFINRYTFDGNKTSVISEVLDGITEAVAKDLLGIIKYIHKFCPELGQTDMEVPGSEDAWSVPWFRVFVDYRVSVTSYGAYWGHCGYAQHVHSGGRFGFR